MPYYPRTTPAQRDQFFALYLDGARVAAACRIAKVSYSTAQRWIKATGRKTARLPARNLSVFMPARMHTELEARADALGLTKAAVVRNVLARYLNL